MPSAFSHAALAAGLGSWYRPALLARVWIAGMLCSALPDLDVIGFRYGIRYGDFLGHRGFTHSLLFAALLAGIVTILLPVSGAPTRGRFAVGVYLFLATASHGLLDAMTNGGLGVAFFSPFDNHRYFLPWRPIQVAPIGVGRFFSASGLAVLRSELLWVWLPALGIALLAFAVRYPRVTRLKDRSPAS
jgi:inner membrane protein